ncbi:class I SAM-dependent methyltransferase [Blautia sp. RD014234]|nr:class I SAM-dependent methyltransferase [Blautia parvula]
MHPEFIQVGEQLPFEDESFDIVISRDVTWMLMEPEKTLEQWFSKVRPGGRLMYFDANWYGYLKDREETKNTKSFANLSESVRALYMPVRWKWKNSSPSSLYLS